MDTLTPAADTCADDDTPKTPAKRERYRALLLDLDRLLGEHPEIDPPYISSDGDTQFCVFSGDIPQVVATLRRVIGGKWDKKPTEDEAYFRFTGEWHGSAILVSTPRDAVCRKVVKGTELRPVEKVVQAAVTETVMEPVEIVEWVCEPLLAPRPAVAGEAPAAIEQAQDAA